MKPSQIAALAYGPDDDASSVLIEAVRALQRRGILLAGAIQHDSASCAMELELLPCGRRLPISQNLGSGATGCRLDTGALADAAARVRQALETGPELAVFNKFGAQEAAGRGLRDEMALAAVAGIPVLVAVSERFWREWTAFTGGEFVQLGCSSAGVLNWWGTG